MRIPKQANIISKFTCINYPELNFVTYKMCIGRQLTKLAGGGSQYPDCVKCHTGKKIALYFKDYQYIPKKGNKGNWNTDLKFYAQNKEKKKRAKIGTSPYSPQYAGLSNGKISGFEPDNKGSIPFPAAKCEECKQLLELKTLVKAQIDFTISLLNEGNLDSAMVRLGLLLEEI